MSIYVYLEFLGKRGDRQGKEEKETGKGMCVCVCVGKWSTGKGGEIKGSRRGKDGYRRSVYMVKEKL